MLTGDHRDPIIPFCIYFCVYDPWWHPSPSTEQSPQPGQCSLGGDPDFLIGGPLVQQEGMMWCLVSRSTLSFCHCSKMWVSPVNTLPPKPRNTLWNFLSVQSGKEFKWRSGGTSERGGEERGERVANGVLWWSDNTFGYRNYTLKFPCLNKWTHAWFTDSNVRTDDNYYISYEEDDDFIIQCTHYWVSCIFSTRESDHATAARNDLSDYIIKQVHEQGKEVKITSQIKTCSLFQRVRCIPIWLI